MIKTVTFRPSRIGCPSIPGTVKGIIVSLPGVQDVEIYYEERSIGVSFDDSKISEDAISKKIGEEIGLAFVPVHPGEKPGGSDGAAFTCPM
ncbi:MAG: hypothetical protein WD896_00080 [Parcubacteria group bacterium]